MPYRTIIIPSAPRVRTTRRGDRTNKKSGASHGANAASVSVGRTEGGAGAKQRQDSNLSSGS